MACWSSFTTFKTRLRDTLEGTGNKNWKGAQIPSIPAILQVCYIEVDHKHAYLLPINNDDTHDPWYLWSTSKAFNRLSRRFKPIYNVGRNFQLYFGLRGGGFMSLCQCFFKAPKSCCETRRLQWKTLASRPPSPQCFMNAKTEKRKNATHKATLWGPLEISIFSCNYDAVGCLVAALEHLAGSDLWHSVAWRG